MPLSPASSDLSVGPATGILSGGNPLGQRSFQIPGIKQTMNCAFPGHADNSTTSNRQHHKARSSEE